MRQTHTLLQLLRERGKKRLPLKRVYRLLYNPGLFLTAYGRIYRNAGAMTKGTTEETADGMAVDKINTLIDDLRHERYRWSPARRVNIPKKNGTTRPLGVQSWSDKLVQEVIRLLLDAYLEPQFTLTWVSTGTRMPYGTAGNLSQLGGQCLVHRGRYLEVLRRALP